MPTKPHRRIALRVADDQAQAQDLSPIPDAVRLAFGTTPSMNIAGEHVIGYADRGSGFEFVRYHGGQLVRTDVLVASKSQPTIDPASLDALVVDPYHRTSWRVAMDGTSRRLGQAPPSFRITDLRVMADGTLALIAIDGTVGFYAATDDGTPPRPLGRVATGLGFGLEVCAVPGMMAILATDGDTSLVVLGVKRERDGIEVRRLARFDNLIVPLPFFILDEEGRENRMPQRAAVYESGVANEVDGIPEALARFADWPLVGLEPAALLDP